MRPPSPRLTPIGLLLLGVAWIWLTRLPPGVHSDADISAPQSGFSAPDFTLESLDGAVFSLSELRGRPVLVNLWASWCGPCRAEMPAIQRVYDDYGPKGLVVLAVNVTAQDSEAAARAFAEEYGLDFPILLDRTGAVAVLYQNRALPSSYFIDPAGTIREVVIGGPMAEALLRTRIAALWPGGLP